MRKGALACWLALAVSCAGDGVRDSTGGTMPAPVGFQTIQDTIFTPRCAIPACHTGPSPPQGLNLSAGMAFANLVNVPSTELMGFFLVEPLDAMDSYLFMKITGDPRIVGTPMPQVGSPLTAGEIALIESWIDSGAPNN